MTQTPSPLPASLRHHSHEARSPWWSLAIALVGLEAVALLVLCVGWAALLLSGRTGAVGLQMGLRWLTDFVLLTVAWAGLYGNRDWGWKVALFAQACAAVYYLCHGDTGVGSGAAGVGFAVLLGMATGGTLRRATPGYWVMVVLCAAWQAFAAKT